MLCHLEKTTKHNARFRAKDQRRKFLRELANMLCMPTREAPCNNRVLIRNHYLRSEVEMVVGRRIVTLREYNSVARAPHGSRGPTPIAGRPEEETTKIRKSRVIWEQPLCNERSVSKMIRILFKNKTTLLSLLVSSSCKYAIDWCRFYITTSSFNNHD